MSLKGLLIDYEFCTNCHTCEVACNVEKNLPANRWGIKVLEIGPWLHEGKAINEFIPNPTELCDLCAERVEAGKLPSCVHNCYSDCMKYGTVEELTKELERKPMQVLFVPRNQ